VLIHPWDAALDDDEWRTWLANGHDFGQLAANGLRGQPPTVIPTHFAVEETAAGTQLLVHLARPNPVWANIEADPNVVLTVVDDYAYILTSWRAKAGGPDEDGVPTSYYAAVQLRCRAELIDDPHAKAELLRGSCPTSSQPGTMPRSLSASRRTGGCCPASADCACT
jgi:transcriptional regulator